MDEENKLRAYREYEEACKASGALYDILKDVAIAFKESRKRVHKKTFDAFGVDESESSLWEIVKFWEESGLLG